MLNECDAEISKGVSMGGRFGKYGDAKHKAQVCKKLAQEEEPSLRNCARSARTGVLSSFRRQG
jgi:hypothetical protein